jgi:hypothetical protein
MSLSSRAEILAHVREHAKYPFTKSELIAFCAGMSDVPKAEREWVEQNLPDRTYSTADEVIRSLKL